jgi:hypothetical protein
MNRKRMVISVLSAVILIVGMASAVTAQIEPGAVDETLSP